jgi:hypothetical protein
VPPIGRAPHVISLVPGALAADGAMWCSHLRERSPRVVSSLRFAMVGAAPPYAEERQRGRH